VPQSSKPEALVLAYQNGTMQFLVQFRFLVQIEEQKLTAFPAQQQVVLLARQE
jgi:hypothetical protein